MKQDFQKLYSALNEAQREAVDTIEGPLMVVAGPGTGKTQLLSVRIANILLKTQSNPQNILCLTFTDSGAKAMRDRLTSIIGETAYQVQIHTFHSFCNEVIFRFRDSFPRFTEAAPLSDIESITIFKECIDTSDLEVCKPLNNPYYYLRHFRSAIQDLKRENISPERLQEIVDAQQSAFDAVSDDEKINQRTGKIKIKYLQEEKKVQKHRDLLKVYSAYSAALIKRGAYDFDDLLMSVIEQLEKNELLLRYIQENLHYLLIDEYQDTNGAQNTILKLLCQNIEQPNICVVGDDDQSIYRFQGACLENILHFGTLFPGFHSVVLTNNYRSSQSILDAARSIIEKNENRLASHMNLEKKLTAQRDYESRKIDIVTAATGDTEVRFIVSEIQKLQQEGTSLSEIAILFRHNSDAFSLIEEFKRADIPYFLNAPENILEDVYVTRFLQLCTAIAFLGKHTDERFFDLLHAAFWEIPAEDIYRLTRTASKQHAHPMDILIDLPNEQYLAPEKLRNVRNTMLHLEQLSKNTTCNAFFEAALKETGFLEYLLGCESRLVHLRNIKRLFKYLVQLNQRTPGLTLKQFLHHIGLFYEHKVRLDVPTSAPQEDAIQLMTAHKSKGLEFEYVFVMSAYDTKWGNPRDRQMFAITDHLVSQDIVTDHDPNEDERRLFFVALTRAKKHAYITYANEYYLYGSLKQVSPTQFIAELDLATYTTRMYTETTATYENTVTQFFNAQESAVSNDYVRSLVDNFVLSPTSLNKFLECPRKFFYDHILRVPKAKTPALALGTSIHKALEDFFKTFQKSQRAWSIDELLASFEQALKREILTTELFQDVLTEGHEILQNYYAHHKDNLIAPLFTEFDFRAHSVRYEGVPITGKIDKIEQIGGSNAIRVIDYKTGKAKSANYLAGKTKDADERFKNQLYFYALLAESDVRFPYQVQEVVFDFVKDTKQVPLTIVPDEYAAFKKQVVDAYAEIQSLTFTNADFKEVCSTIGPNRGACEFLNVCWTKTPRKKGSLKRPSHIEVSKESRIST